MTSSPSNAGVEYGIAYLVDAVRAAQGCARRVQGKLFYPVSRLDARIVIMVKGSLVASNDGPATYWREVERVDRPFAAGTLWNRVEQATETALASGALRPISTGISYIEEAGVVFPVRRVLPYKETHSSRVTKNQSPFLHPESALCVADLSETHLCLLNKFPVFPHHLLIVTREFEQQESLLGLADFYAIWRCMSEYDSLSFYNSGSSAGASQRHKHLQVVPLPLAPRGSQVPIEPLLDMAALGKEIGRFPSLPFSHVAAALPTDLGESPYRAAEVTASLYKKMLRESDLLTQDELVGSYNLLVSSAWMLLVPRFHEHYSSISLNALAFAGHFLVRTDADIERLQTDGPMAALQHVASR